MYIWQPRISNKKHNNPSVESGSDAESPKELSQLMTLAHMERTRNLKYGNLNTQKKLRGGKGQ